jgi:hypothetical protein
MANNATHTSIAYQTVQDQRASTPIQCGQRGTLHDYVPFYFTPLSPMLFKISRGNVDAYTGGQEPLVHLVSTAQAVRATNLRFVFSDGHGIMMFTEFFDDLAQLDKIDWEVIKSKYWKDTADNPDRKRRRQAEFLVHEFCTWDVISEIGVMTPSMKIKVENLLVTSRYKPVVKVRAQWYY